MLLEELDTPSLWVDLDKMDANLKAMQSRVASLGYQLRPHTKAHKIPDIALKQIELGASGICTAKLGEAEVMLQGGVKDILITTPIASGIKFQRLAKLVEQYPDARVIQVVDHPQQVSGIAEALNGVNLNIELLIEVESGQQRCGVELGDKLLQLVRHIQATPGVVYKGIQAYSGHLQHVPEYAERNRQARAAVEPIFEFIAEVMQPLGLEPEVVSGGGTGTFEAYEGLGFTEIQAGSYPFMDRAYCEIGNADGQAYQADFSSALKVLTCVISHPVPERAVVDAGMKALSIDLGMPVVDGLTAISYKSGGDEHGILNLTSAFSPLKLGQLLSLTPSHCDTTLNNFDTLYGIRKGKVQERWNILGRGRCD